MCNTFPEPEQCSLYAYAYANTMGPPQKKIPLFSPLPPLFSMTYIFIEHICVIPFRNQNNAAFMHMLMQVGPRKKN